MNTTLPAQLTTIIVGIDDIILNDTNPRFIREDKLEKLSKSVKEFPEMLQIRPIVVNKEMKILGGNMRYKACKEAGLKEIPVIVAQNLSVEQENEFLIKDNVSGGEWDWGLLGEQFEFEQLDEWGLDTIKNDWEDLDYIEEDIEAPIPTGNNVIQIILPETLIEDKDEIFEAVKEFLSEKYEGCEVK